MYQNNNLKKKENEKTKKHARISINELRQLQAEEEAKLRKDAIVLFSRKT